MIGGYFWHSSRPTCEVCNFGKVCDIVLYDHETVLIKTGIPIFEAYDYVINQNFQLKEVYCSHCGIRYYVTQSVRMSGQCYSNET